MPLYEYRCDDCQTRFEVLQRMSEGAADLSCPECGGSRLAKQFSTFAATTSTGGSTGAAAGRGAPACGAGFT